MNEFIGATKWVPNDGGIRKVRAALPDCRGCDLQEDAEHVVPAKVRSAPG